MANNPQNQALKAERVRAAGDHWVALQLLLLLLLFFWPVRAPIPTNITSALPPVRLMLHTCAQTMVFLPPSSLTNA